MLSNNGSNKRRRKKILKWILVGLMFIVAFWLEFDAVLDGQLYFPYFEELWQSKQNEEPLTSTPTPVAITTESPDVTNLGGMLEYTTYNVGQADCLLFKQGEHYMMVDCATSGEIDDVIKQLKELGVTKLDYLVLTHPHSDHMGGASKVIKYFAERSGIGTVYISDYTTKAITSEWHSNLLQTFIEINGDEEEYIATYEKWEIEVANLSEKKQEQYIRDKNDDFMVEHGYFAHPNVGDVIYLGDAKIQFLAPNSDKYSQVNNYSIVMRVTYGDIDIMLAGDAEKLSEQEIIANGLELESEILKVGHHGSNTSTSDEFLEAVSPVYCIITCKKGHKDQNPDEEVIRKLEEGRYVIRRSDENGKIVLTTDGKNIFWNCEPGDYLSGIELAEKE